MGNALLTCRGVVKTYVQGAERQVVLDGIDLDIEAGSFVAVMGPSGSGKSTLLHLLGGLDEPDSGEVILEGAALSSMTDDQRTLLRRRSVGVVYQFFNLIPVLTVEENVCLPAVIAGQSPASYRDRLDEILDLVDMTNHRHKQPAELSGGQQQRTALARALFVEPRVLLADEPTGNLDLRSGAEILELICTAQDQLGQTTVMVTHDPRSAGYSDQVLMLQSGRIAGSFQPAQRMRGTARSDRSHPSRGRAVLRWLEQSGSKAEGVEPIPEVSLDLTDAKSARAGRSRAATPA